MKHRLFAFFLAALMLVCALPVSAEEATEPTNVERAPGYCGDAILWSFENGTLTLIGTGEMDDFPEGAPWEAHKDEIETVIISNGITYVGERSFYNYDKLKDVQFGDDIYEIGEHAFFSCDGLTAVYLPAGFKVFGPSSFMGCTKLKEIHCEGRFPTFRMNCLWDTYAVIYFPADRPWGVEYIAQLEEAFHGRIEFLASDGTDPYEPTGAPAETEAPTETEVPTEEPTEQTSEPTEEPTEAPTTVPPTTQAPTEEPTEPMVTDAPAEETAGGVTEPLIIMPAPEEKGGSKIPYIILGVVAVFLVFGGLIFGGGRKRGKYSR